MFRLRPLASWITAFAAGILCAVFTEGVAEAVLFAVIGVLCVVCFAVRRFPYRAIVFPLILAVFIGMGYLEVRTHIVQGKVESGYDRRGDITGDVVETDNYGFTLSLISASGNVLPKDTKIRVFYDYEYDVKPGDRVYCSLAFSDPGIDGYAYGTYVYASGDVLRVDSGKGETPLEKFRRTVNGIVQNNFTAKTSGVAKAVLTGDSSDIDPVLYSAYRSSGIAHILVISGFHMSIILMSAYFLLSSTKLGKRYSGLLCIFLTLLFGVFVGFTPSVSRAAVMCVAVFIGGSFNYKNDSFTSLFTALGILLAVNPYSLFSVSLQLSFLCSLGIIILSPALGAAVAKIKKRGLRFAVKQLSSVAISAVSSLFSFPVVCYSFGEFSVISPITNMFAIPISELAVIFGYIGIFIPPVAYVSDILLRLLNGIAVAFSKPHFATVSTMIPGMTVALLIAAVSVVVIGSVKLKKRLPALGICMGCFALCITASVLANVYVGKTKATVNSVSGNGCYQLTVSSEGKCAFVDAGGAYVITNKVFETGSTRLEVYIMTECDSYGLSNLCNMLSAVNIDKIYISADGRVPHIYERVRELAFKYGIETEVFEGNVTLPVGGAYVTAGDVRLVKYGNDRHYFYNKNGTFYLDGRE